MIIYTVLEKIPYEGCQLIELIGNYTSAEEANRMIELCEQSAYYSESSEFIIQQNKLGELPIGV